MILAEKFKNTSGNPSNSRARVELYNGSTLLNIYSESDLLQGFSVERVGEESKFFGFGVCHKITVILGDYEGGVDITDANILEVEYGVGSDFIYTYPYFIISEILRDEAAKEIVITAYDAIAAAGSRYVSELSLPSGELTIKQYAVACANALGLPLSIRGVEDTAFNTKYAQGANLEGTESIRDLLNDIAEATQTIYYIDNEWRLVFKRLDKDGDAVATITDENSMNIIVGETHTLAGITHATELGDNVSVTTGDEGVTQYVRNNAFWDLREDIDELLANAVANVGGMTNTAFSADWFGDILLEVGDKIQITTEDGTTIYSYVLNDVIEYSGITLEQTQWIFSKDEGETTSNPATLGETLKQTYARVNKQDKKIELFVQEVGENLSSIEMSTAGISAQVANTSGEVEKLTETVESKMSADEVSIAIKTEMSSGVSSVVTEKGFTFSDEGLRIAQSGSQMESLLDEDGLKVYRDNDEVLKANNVGVEAINVKVRTYLIVGDNSRFETYDGNRTGCFWIG